MDKREEDFWEYYNPIQELADRHDVSIYTIRNFREIFDYAWKCGELAGMDKAIAIVKGDN